MKRIIVALSITLAAVVGAACQPGGPGPNADQNQDLQLVNQTRASAGKSALAWNPNTAAQSWANHMAATGSFVHNPNYANTPGCGWAENIARAGSVAAAHNGLVNSPGHYANMTGNYSSVGVGVARNGQNVYVVENYVRAC